MLMNKHKVLTGSKVIPYLFILPFMISYIIFFLYPAAYSFILSFFSYKGYGAAKFIGLSNYINLFQYGTMWGCLANTLFYFICSFIPTMIFAFVLALLVRSKPVKKFQAIYKPIIFLPQVCAVVASALCFKIIFGERVGVISQLLGTAVPFLSDTQLMRWTVVIMMTWRAIGWYFIIYLSGLTTISDEITEAANIDGAKPIQTVWHIIMPLMKPTFMMAFITNAIGSLKIYTEPNLMLAQSFDPPMQVAPYTNLIVNSMSSGQFGVACAAGWILVIVILSLTLAQLKFFKGDE
ncbi:MAG: ABC-type transporter, integral rane subunit [Herbinix sp.]|nr:ABC-type transporter, integral rane subunit [Herbinix sp.]